MPLRFYPVNLLLLAAVLLPNLLPMIFPPTDAAEDHGAAGGWRIVNAVEWAARMAVFLLPLFWEIRLETTTQGVLLALMALCMAVYYAGWIRYLAGGRQFRLLFCPLWRIPVPMAVFPSAYFLLAGVLLASWPVTLAACLFAAAHTAESWRLYTLCEK